jgi:PEP-CTERM motif
MKKFGIIVVALAALLVLPASAKADTITYADASGFATGIGAPWSGTGSFSGSSLGPGSQSFSFSTFFNLGGAFSAITIGSGASAFNGIFTTGFSDIGSCGASCTVWTANLSGIGASAGEVGFITLDLTYDFFTGQWRITGGTADPVSSDVPEPGTVGMLAAGLAGLGLMLNRKAKAFRLAA